MSALEKNVRFLFMHGISDDNVHLQNSLALLDKLDKAGVENYDVHVFPDSDHNINFHNAHRMVYGREFLPLLVIGNLFFFFFETWLTLCLRKRSFGLARQCFQRGMA